MMASTMRSVRICLIALLAGVAAAAAQAPVETRGAWRIAADGQDFSLSTQARDAPGSSFSLLCRKEQRRFTFEIKSPALGSRPPGEDIRVGFKVDNDDQVWLTLATGPDGTVPIAHPTAFWIIHAALVRSGAKDVAFTAGDHAWQFALDGFAGLTESLITHCGFEPPRPSRGR
jgi:hypothetical protein